MKAQGHAVREAGFADAISIFNLIKVYPDEVLPRPISGIVENIDRFLVCERDGEIAGAVSWQILPEMGRVKDPSVEIKSLCVAKAFHRQGIGSALVAAAIAHIERLRPAKIVVLTFTPAFFARFGFKECPKETLMHKLYMGCINCSKYDSPFTCPEVAMTLDVL
ncbi:MAG: GNAT family N-acetyltransferase [Kiritimatiellae bacterium]|nr:GNAT family N-acetyltransferase [Kiritimatiellia bacterium]